MFLRLLLALSIALAFSLAIPALTADESPVPQGCAIAIASDLSGLGLSAVPLSCGVPL